MPACLLSRHGYLIGRGSPELFRRSDVCPLGPMRSRRGQPCNVLGCRTTDFIERLIGRRPILGERPIGATWCRLRLSIVSERMSESEGLESQRERLKLGRLNARSQPCAQAGTSCSRQPVGNSKGRMRSSPRQRCGCQGRPFPVMPSVNNRTRASRCVSDSQRFSLGPPLPQASRTSRSFSSGCKRSNTRLSCSSLSGPSGRPSPIHVPDLVSI